MFHELSQYNGSHRAQFTIVFNKPNLKPARGQCTNELRGIHTTRVQSTRIKLNHKLQAVRPSE